MTNFDYMPVRLSLGSGVVFIPELVYNIDIVGEPVLNNLIDLQTLKLR